MRRLENARGTLRPHLLQFDFGGRIVRHPLGNVLRDVSYDAADRITGFTHLLASDGTPQPALNQGFAYDENSRLTSIITSASSWSIAYDPTGNRTSVSLNGIPSTYATETTSNRLTGITNPARSFGYDNAGNTTSDSAGYTASYGLNGSIASITKSGVTGSYDYDAERRRIRKVTSTGETVIFVYDLEGQLLGKYDQTGKALREYVWLDNIPVAMFMPDPANASNPSAAPLVFYIHADHLNAPRIVVDPSGAKRWRWLAEPFGTTAPETNPDGLGSFTQNLRFPGQYADVESGLWYNYFRSYDKDSGRYTQSDPIGLGGGMNTYIYIEGNPLSYADPTGELVFVPILIGIGVGYAFDYLLEQYKKEHCTCKETPLGAGGNSALGGTLGGTGPFASKPRGGIAGGGPAGSGTSSVSLMNHAAARRGWYSVPTRNLITKVARKVPYVGAGLMAYELYDAFSCD
jgi:RHS repeat-associated protein